MALKEVHKLVRDKIPELIKAEGGACEFRVLNEGNAYTDALFCKLHEEAMELRQAYDRSGINEDWHQRVVDELADVRSVVEELQIMLGVRTQSIHEAAKRKLSEKGGFEKHIFLLTCTEAAPVAAAPPAEIS